MMMMMMMMKQSLAEMCNNALLLRTNRCYGLGDVTLALLSSRGDNIRLRRNSKRRRLRRFNSITDMASLSPDPEEW